VKRYSLSLKRGVRVSNKQKEKMLLTEKERKKILYLYKNTSPVITKKKREHIQTENVPDLMPII